MIDIKMYRAYGTASGGAPASTMEVTNWNMKDSASYTVAYYPTNEGIGQAPLIRPTTTGDQVFSYPVYTFFTITGAYSMIKNIRLELSVDTATQASGAQLFYKMTNVYATPAAAFDGDMQYLATAAGTLLETKFYPMISTTGPTTATTRAKSYTNPSGTTTLYTNFFVTQTRVNVGSAIGNTAEFRLRLRADEYGPF